MRQVVVIHGGDAYASYDSYLANLRNWKIESADFFRGRRDWKANLQETLGDGYDVLKPQMPCKQNAKYAEWKIWFEKLVPFLENGSILIGHSLGGVFLAKYLSEETLPMKVAATMLVAAPHSMDSEEAIEFSAPTSLAKLEAQGGKLFIYHSEDDPVVPAVEAHKYVQALPTAALRMFTDRRHFNQEAFPELVAEIENVFTGR